MKKNYKFIVYIFLFILAVMLCGCTQADLNNDEQKLIPEDKIVDINDDWEFLAQCNLALTALKTEFDINNVVIKVCFGNLNSYAEDYYEYAYGYEKGNFVNLKIYVSDFISSYDNLLSIKENVDYYDATTGKINEKYIKNYSKINKGEEGEGDSIKIPPELFCEEYGQIFVFAKEYLYNGSEMLTYGEGASGRMYYEKCGDKIKIYFEKPSFPSKLSYAITVKATLAEGFKITEYASESDISVLKNDIFNAYLEKKNNILYDWLPDLKLSQFSLTKALYIENDDKSESAYVFWIENSASVKVCKNGMQLINSTLPIKPTVKDGNAFCVVAGSVELYNLILSNSYKEV